MMSPVVEYDPAEKLRAYAHPERLVTTAWLAEHLEDPNLVVAESDEDVLLYETGHIPGAVKIDWHLDLNDPVTRDYVDGQGFARLMSSKGIAQRHHDRVLRRQLQLVGRLRPVGLHPVRARRCAAAGRRPPAVDPGGVAAHHRGAPAATQRVSGAGARRQDHPGLPRRRVRVPIERTAEPGPDPRLKAAG
jgi:hypothetical protein